MNNNKNYNNDNIINYTIQENDKTVKDIMLENLKFSKRLSKKLELSSKILLNDKIAKLNKSAFKGDILSVEFNDEQDEYNAINIPIEIIYEDSEMIIINKPPYIVVHPTKSHQDNTIANGVAYYFKEKNILKKVRFVNRLDMNTSGIVIIAKNPYIHNEISNQMKSNIVEKYYYAIVEGLLEQDKGTINEPICRLNAEDIIRVVDPSGKECITHYEVKGRYKDKTLVKLKLETGRTHQIRVHMKYIGHPVMGDTLYGNESKEIGRQALHCYEIIFVHPLTGEKMTIKCELPDDMKKLISL